jgi:2-oxoglutarate ferredoxin oxidoreductase subunit beta
VSRWTTYHVFPLIEAMQNALSTDGFSFVEIISQCPVSYGKMTGTSDPVALLEQLRDASIHIDDTRGMTEEELEGKFVVGKLVERQQAEFGESLRRLVAERREALSAELEHGLRQDTSALETGR